MICVLQCEICDCGFCFGQAWLALGSRINSHRAAYEPGGPWGPRCKVRSIFAGFDWGIVRRLDGNGLAMRGQHKDMFVGWFEAGIVGLNRGAGLVAVDQIASPL